MLAFIFLCCVITGCVIYRAAVRPILSTLGVI